MKMNTEQFHDREDMHLVNLLVAKQLRQGHPIQAPPPLADYSVEPTGKRYAGTPELHVRFDLGRGVTAQVDRVWTRSGQPERSMRWSSGLCRKRA